MDEREPIERAFFREADDGSTVFFPWGLAHRGYRLTGEAAKEKASRAASFLLGSVIGVGTWAAYALEPVFESEGVGLAETLDALAAPGAVLLLALVSYALWISRFVEQFPDSDLRVSREERLREASAAIEPRKVALVGIVVCGLSALLIWIQPQTWWLASLGLAIGVGALFWSSLLKRAGSDPPGLAAAHSAAVSPEPSSPRYSSSIDS
ncbi:MAG: hypothetical protein JRF15_01345 [Deltaproteobacteria bacterium]|jgi:hypothetical protein|nr:hypothetical protein [Deltaproteobacteria bacterium]